MPIRAAWSALPDGAKGMLLMSAGIGVITVNDALMKLANEGLPLGETLFIRSVFVWVMIIIFAWRAGGVRSLAVYDWPRQGLRGCFLIISSWCFFFGLAALPLAEAIAIASVGPLFLTMLAGPLLGETVGWRRWCAVGVGFVGRNDHHQSRWGWVSVGCTLSIDRGVVGCRAGYRAAADVTGPGRHSCNLSGINDHGWPVGLGHPAVRVGHAKLDADPAHRCRWPADGHRALSND